MANWFNETFLPSLFGRCGVGKGMWLSVKQTNICCDNMERHDAFYQGDAGGTTYNSIYYTYQWEGRRVILKYSKKNGCGRIEFGFNEAEQEANRRAAELEKAEMERKHIEFVKSRPHILARKLSGLDSEIRRYQEALEDELSYEDADQEYIEFYRNHIASLTAEKAKYL